MVSTKTILWIDDNSNERAEGSAVLEQIGGITPVLAASSAEAREVLEQRQVDAIVTDILRRNENRSIAEDDGYRFFREYIRPKYPRMQVLFHTKNLPSTFEVDNDSEYLSKWETTSKKAIELEVRLSERLRLYEAYADWHVWHRIEPRLVEVKSKLLDTLSDIDDVWLLTADQFEQLASELLNKLGYSVLWIPGGKDGGIDIVASSQERDFLIDVKRYRSTNPVSVELVRAIYGVAESVSSSRPCRIVHGGIITSSRFTKEADIFRKTVRPRPLLKDGDWLKTELTKFAPRLRH